MLQFHTARKWYYHLHNILTLLWLVGIFASTSNATPNSNTGDTTSSSLPSVALPTYSNAATAIDDDATRTTSTTSLLPQPQLLQEEEDDEDEEGWRKSLPPGLRNKKGAPLHRIFIKDNEVVGEGGVVVLYLLGSSHVSRASCEDAKLLMEHVRPDVLFVELCSQRVGLLLDDPAPPSSESISGEQQIPINNNKDQSSVETMTPISQKGNLLFAKIQSDYAKKLNVTIGGEFRQAFQSALAQQRQFWESRHDDRYRQRNQRTSNRYYFMHAKDDDDSPSSSNNNPTIIGGSSRTARHPRGIRPCAIILGDRPVRITLLRAWESLRFFGKFKLMVALLWSSIKSPSEKELREFMESILNDRSGKNDLLTKSMEELGKVFPSLKRVIIEERDEFMVAKLRQTARGLLLMMQQSRNGSTGGAGAGGEEKVMVALVGAGHCPGMLEKLMQDDDDDVIRRPEEILTGILETKKRKVGNDEEIASLVHDIVQFDYSYVLQNGIH